MDHPKSAGLGQIGWISTQRAAGTSGICLHVSDLGIDGPRLRQSCVNIGEMPLRMPLIRTRGHITPWQR